MVERVILKLSNGIFVNIIASLTMYSLLRTI